MELRRLLYSVGSDGRCVVCPDVKRGLHALCFYGLIQQNSVERYVDPTGTIREVRSLSVVEEAW